MLLSDAEICPSGDPCQSARLQHNKVEILMWRFISEWRFILVEICPGGDLSWWRFFSVEMLRFVLVEMLMPD